MRAELRYQQALTQAGSPWREHANSAAIGWGSSSLAALGRRTSATTSTECAWELPGSRREPDRRRGDIDVELEPQARREPGQSVNGGSDLARFKTSDLRLLHAEQLR